MLSQVQSQQFLPNQKRLQSLIQPQLSTSISLAKVNQLNNQDRMQNLNQLRLKQRYLDGQQNDQMLTKQSRPRYSSSNQFDSVQPMLPQISSIRRNDDEAISKSSQIQTTSNNNARLPPKLPKLDNTQKDTIDNKSIELKTFQRKKHQSYDSNINVKEESEGSQATPDRKYTEENEDNKIVRKNEKYQSLVVSYSQKTKAGCQTNKQPKTNQDTAIMNPINLESLGYNFFAVCDGHGVNGHIVSGYIKNNLSKHLTRYIKDKQSKDTLESKLSRAFSITNKEIWNSDVDTNLSGSTTVSIILKQDRIWSANVGDSRAIMCRQASDGWQVIELSQDHKPSEEMEKKRIIEAGGRIETQKDYYGNQVGPERVWMQFIDAPGLAMTRSMGDKAGAQAGVIAEPEIKEFKIEKEDRFIVVASDGVWEYLSNEDIMNIVIPYFDRDNPEQASDRVVVESINAWKKQSYARDDITCIVIFFSK